MKKMLWVWFVLALTAILFAICAYLIVRDKSLNIGGRTYKVSNDDSKDYGIEIVNQQTDDTDSEIENIVDFETENEIKNIEDVLDNSLDNTIINERKQINMEEEFYIAEISDELFEKMQGKSYKSDCTVPREELRYVHVLHIDFDGNTKEGEIVCNKHISQDILEIFEDLYKAEYPIEKVKLVDEYDADDESSMSDNNSSSFNYRCISYTNTVSKHGRGLAIDINPLYNPYIKEVNGKTSIEPACAEAYVDRDKDFPHKIDENDLCYKLFIEHGFSWGGAWKNSKDYQHFEYDLD